MGFLEQCPRCGAIDVDVEFEDWEDIYWYCDNCGYEWKLPKD